MKIMVPTQYILYASFLQCSKGSMILEGVGRYRSAKHILFDYYLIDQNFSYTWKFCLN